MSSRLEIELTSERPDGTWTWRAAGAKQPKGDLDAILLPPGTAVGAVLKVDAEVLVDGIEIIAVLAPKAPRNESGRLEILGSGKSEPLVTTQLAGKSKGKGKGRGRKGGRGSDRSGGDSRPAAPPRRPDPKRLRPGREHRDALLADLAPEQRPIGEQVLRGGIPAVREQIAKQNEQAAKDNRPKLPEGQVVAMAEKLVPQLRRAEWRDRAEAALADLEELDLRDLRSVVVAAEDGARDDETRAMRDQLSEGLTRRVSEEQGLWVDDMTENLDAGRFVRALRISSRPPKAGAPVPSALSDRLVTTVTEGLNSRTKQEVYAATLDALSFSPVRARVRITSKPEKPSEDLVEAVRRTADKLPDIAAEFGVDPKEANAARRRYRAKRRADAKAAKQAPKAESAPANKPKKDGPKSYKPPKVEPEESRDPEEPQDSQETNDADSTQETKQSEPTIGDATGSDEAADSAPEAAKDDSVASTAEDPNDSVESSGSDAPAGGGDSAD